MCSNISFDFSFLSRGHDIYSLIVTRLFSYILKESFFGNFGLQIVGKYIFFIFLRILEFYEKFWTQVD